MGYRAEKGGAAEGTVESGRSGGRRAWRHHGSRHAEAPIRAKNAHAQARGMPWSVDRASDVDVIRGSGAATHGL